MALSALQRQAVADILRDSLRDKMRRYAPEPAMMPFHTRLLGRDRMAMFSFIHSLNTRFGVSIFEPVAKTLAQHSFKYAGCQEQAGKRISSQAQQLIQRIMDELGTGAASPDKKAEIAALRKVCRQGDMREIKPVKVDIKLISHDDVMYLIDMKTAKPNAGGFKEYKRTLLEWAAVTLADNPRAKVESLIGIPYNPYAPQPYQRWTMRGMLDMPRELKVAEDLWEFLAGAACYEDLLDVFEETGIELRDEIDAYFRRYLT